LTCTYALYKKLCRAAIVPKNERWTHREWLELMAEGLMFPYTVSKIGQLHDERGYVPGAKVSAPTADGPPPPQRRKLPPAGKDKKKIKECEAGTRPRGRLAAQPKQLSEKKAKQISNTMKGSEKDLSLEQRTFNPGVHKMVPIVPPVLRKKFACKRCMIHKGKRVNPHMTCEYCMCKLCLECWPLWHEGK
jgi:hypothetical protein